MLLSAVEADTQRTAETMKTVRRRQQQLTTQVINEQKQDFRQLS